MISVQGDPRIEWVQSISSLRECTVVGVKDHCLDTVSAMRVNTESVLNDILRRAKFRKRIVQQGVLFC